MESGSRRVVPGLLTRRRALGSAAWQRRRPCWRRAKPVVSPGWHTRAPTSPPAPRSTSQAVPTQAVATPTVPTVDQPRTGGILRQGNLGDLPTLDGNFLNGQSTIYPVWDRLVELDPQLNPKGILAESWDVDDKYTRIALHLRKGVQWHTGRELTADDVAWNIRRVSSDPKVAGGGFYNWMSQTLTGIETADKYTVVLLAERSWPAVFDTLSLLSIIDPVTFEASGPAQAHRHRPIHFRRVRAGRPLHAEEEPELLAIRQTVPRRHRDQDLLTIRNR